MGKMSAPMASTGSMKALSPDTMMSGIAKPTAPFTKPARSVTATAPAQTSGERSIAAR